MTHAKAISLSIILMILVILAFNGYVAIYYDYWFKSYSPNDFLSYVPAGIAILLPLGFNSYLKRPSDFLCWTYFLLVTIPTTALSPQLGLSTSTTFKTGIIVIATNIIIAAAGKFYINHTVNKIRFLNGKWFAIIFFGIGIVAMTLVFRAYTFNIRELLTLAIFIDTYEIRAAFRESEAEGLAVYSIFWAAKIIFPGIIVFGLSYDKKIYIWAGIFFQLLLFTVSAHKSFLLSSILIFVVYMLATRRSSFITWLKYSIAFIGFSLFVFYSYSISIFVDVFVRRAFIVPGILSSYWVEYFALNPYAFFAGGFVGNFFDNENTTPAPFRIGDYYFGNNWTSANVNFAIDAFGNGGPIYLFIAWAIVFLSLTVINSAASIGHRERIFFICISVPLFWTLIETSLITTMITHGLFILLGIAFIWKNYIKNN